MTRPLPLCRRTALPLLGALLSLAVPVVAQTPDVLITGGHLFDGVSGDTRPNPGILVRAGKFLAVGDVRSDLVGADATRVELAGDEYILPGMFDLHAHHAIDLFGQGRVDEREAYPVLFLANGVTTVFPGGEVNPVEMREMRLRIDGGEQVGPRVLNSGPYFGSWRAGWDREMTADSIYAEVDYWVARGARGFKAKGISEPHLRALLDRAHAHGVPVTGHLDSGYRGSVNPRDAILMGIDRVEHFLGGDAMPADRSAYASLVDMETGTAEFDSIAALYIRHDVYFDATLTAYGYYGERDPEVYTDWTDEMRFLTPYMRRAIEAREPRPVSEQFERIYWVKRRTLKAFYDAGGRDLVTLGTDHPSWGEFFSGFSVHRELHAFVLSGIPPADALRFATVNPARAMGLSARLGTVEAGKLADLYVIRGNPLDDITNTRNGRLVMKAGRLYDPGALLRSVEGTIGPAGPGEESAWKPRARN